MVPDAPPQRGTSPAPRTSPGQPSSRDAASLKTMTFLEHLQELRSTLVRMLVVTLVCGCGAWFVSEPILALLVAPDLGAVHYFGPAEGLMIRLKVSLVTGLLVAAPFLLAQVWAFVAPGLFRHERRAVLPVLVASSSLFYFGVVFGYVAVIPKTVSFLLSFAGERLTPLINVSQYFSFVAKFCLAFGVAFQLPLVIVLLAALGIATPQQLWRQWRYGVVFIFVVAAWLTPPDVVSQLMMAGPLVVLYLGSIGLAFLLARRRRARQ